MALSWTGLRGGCDAKGGCGKGSVALESMSGEAAERLQR